MKINVKILQGIWIYELHYQTQRNIAQSRLQINLKSSAFLKNIVTKCKYI